VQKLLELLCFQLELKLLEGLAEDPVRRAKPHWLPESFVRK